MLSQQVKATSRSEGQNMRAAAKGASVCQLAASTALNRFESQTGHMSQGTQSAISAFVGRSFDGCWKQCRGS